MPRSGPDPNPVHAGGPYDLVTLEPVDPQDEDHLREWAAVQNRSSEHDLGDHAAPWTAEELRSHAFSHSYDRSHLGAVDRATGEWIGMARISFPLRDNLHLGTLVLHVDPAHRGRGVGSLLLGWAEEQARGAGRSIIMTEVNLLLGQQDSVAARFADRHGYAVAQRVLRSDHSLGDLAELERIDAELAERLASDGYALATSVNGIPESWLADRALLQRRMSTDTPLGDVAIEEEDWDAERVRADYEITLQTRRTVDTTVVHRESGQHVGFTAVGISDGPPLVAYQQDTLVLREHRGHALGLALKARNAIELARAFSRVPLIRTFNADDNTHMLAINRRLGYVTTVEMQARQKRL